MKYIVVTTPDNIDVEYRLAGTGSRMGAAAIDMIIQFCIFAVIAAISVFTLVKLDKSILSIDPDNILLTLTILIIAYFLIFFLYFLVLEILMKGQTIGKRLLGLRTIRQNGQPITFLQAVTRNLIRVFIDNNGIGILIMLFSKQNKRLGDIAAGTIVVSENPDIIKSDALKIKEIGNYNSNALNTNYLLTVAEYELLKDYFSRRDTFSDEGISAQAKLTEYFSEKFNLNPQSVSEHTLYQFMKDNSKMY